MPRTCASRASFAGCVKSSHGGESFAVALSAAFCAAVADSIADALLDADVALVIWELK